MYSWLQSTGVLKYVGVISSVIGHEFQDQGSNKHPRVYEHYMLYSNSFYYNHCFYLSDPYHKTEMLHQSSKEYPQFWNRLRNMMKFNLPLVPLSSATVREVSLSIWPLPLQSQWLCMLGQLFQCFTWSQLSTPLKLTRLVYICSFMKYLYLFVLVFCNSVLEFQSANLYHA